MADELRFSIDAEFAKSGESWNARDLDLLDQLQTVAGSHNVSGTGTATTSAAALGIGAITTCGWLFFKNRGSVTIHIRYGVGGTNAFSFPAGVGYAVYLAASNPFVLSASSTAKYEYKLFEA